MRVKINNLLFIAVELSLCYPQSFLNVYVGFSEFTDCAVESKVVLQERVNHEGI